MQKPQHGVDGTSWPIMHAQREFRPQGPGTDFKTLNSSLRLESLKSIKRGV